MPRDYRQELSLRADVCRRAYLRTFALATSDHHLNFLGSIMSSQVMRRVSRSTLSFSRNRQLPQARLNRSITSTPRVSADPWPLPHTPEHLASTLTPSDVDPLPPLPRHNESIDTLRARLVYQSRKRGTLESDLLLSTFARDHLSGMSEEELMEYDKVCVCLRIRYYMRGSLELCLCSCWTNQTGISTIGPPIIGHRLKDGQAPLYSTS